MTDLNSSSPSISIIVPTFNRHDGVTRTLKSIFALKDEALGTSEIIVADNSADANARNLIASLEAESPVALHYVSEPKPGVSNVRNKALSIARSSLIAWLDDDQTAGQGWLDELLSARNDYNAAVSFGPTIPVLPEHATKHQHYFNRFFERPQRPDDGVITEFFGCGHSMVDLDKVRPHMEAGAPIFDKAANDRGGEDDRLFQFVLDSGEKIAWNRKATAYEHPPEHRVNLGYTLRRSFVYGQGPTCIAAHRNPPDILKVVYWMLVGAGQATVYGLITAALYLTGKPGWVTMADKSIRGLGKLLWFPPFRIKLYGTGYGRHQKRLEKKAKAKSTANVDNSTTSETSNVTPTTNGSLEQSSRP